MARPASHPPGTFNWDDLRTTNLEAAKRFYAELFGWRYTVMDPTGGDYTVALVDGDPVAGLKVLSAGQAGGGDSPFWLSYVAVGSADAAAARTHRLGGSVRAEPFDRGTSRLTVINDPAGGKLCLWQSPEQAGACRIAEPGCVTWHDLYTGDAQAARTFYTELFGWRIEAAGNAAGRSCGVRALDTARDGVPAQWVPYFAVTSIEEALARVRDGGGRMLTGPRDGPAGRCAIVGDPQGARLGLVASHPAT